MVPEKNGPIPSIDDCLTLMDEYEMLDNIRAHSFQVARVAETLMEAMEEADCHPLPDLDLVVTGALLHDIAKTPCLYRRCNHAKRGKKICLEKGYPEIGEIVREHVVLYDFSKERYRQGVFFAKEIVYYADKRVRHDAVVSLDQRLDYILENYGGRDKKIHELIRENFQRCREMEAALFSFLNFPAHELARHVSSKPFLRPFSTCPQELSD